MRILEEEQPIAESKIWQLISNYYIHKGPETWTSEETPSFATSSCYIAHYYAQIIIHTLQDWSNNPSFHVSSETPFYILELSSGLGEFAYHCLQQLNRLCLQYQLTDIKFCYVLTDLVEKNRLLWKKSGAFAEYLKKNQVDFASYDLTQPTILQLTEAKIQLDAEKLVNPVIVIANYIFDSVPTDLFYANMGQLQRGMMTLKVPKKMSLAQPNDLNNVVTEVHLKSVDTDHVYPEPIFNRILNEYRARLNGGTIHFPIAALRYLQFILNSSSGRLLLLVADKGYSTYEMMRQIDRFHMDYHYSLSTLVNFHALEQFVKYNDGDSFYQDRFTQLVCAVFVTGMQFSETPALKRFLQIYEHELSPQEYCKILHEFSVARQLEPQSLLGLFRLSQYDPILLRLLYYPIMQLSNPYKLSFNEKLRVIFQQMRDNIYPPAHRADLNFQLGSVYHMLGDYSLALEFLEGYTPKPEIACEYYERLQDSYHHLGEAQEVAKIVPLLRVAKINRWMRDLKYKISYFKNYLRIKMRFFVLLIGLAVIIYFLFK